MTVTPTPAPRRCAGPAAGGDISRAPLTETVVRSVGDACHGGPPSGRRRHRQSTRRGYRARAHGPDVLVAVAMGRRWCAVHREGPDLLHGGTPRGQRGGGNQIAAAEDPRTSTATRLRRSGKALDGEPAPPGDGGLFEPRLCNLNRGSPRRHCRATVEMNSPRFTPPPPDVGRGVRRADPATDWPVGVSQ